MGIKVEVDGFGKAPPASFDSHRAMSGIQRGRGCERSLHRAGQVKVVNKDGRPAAVPPRQAAAAGAGLPVITEQAPGEEGEDGRK